MPKTYRECGQEVQDLGDRVLRQWHGNLIDAGLTINYLFVSDVDKDGEAKPALKHAGYPAIATVRINSLKDRAEGKSDVTITIDSYRWDEMSEAERLAVLDHEATHVELKTDADTGNLIRDDLGRPRLMMRLHDHQAGWFHEVAERHGRHSAEQVQLMELSKVRWVQGVLPLSAGAA